MATPLALALLAAALAISVQAARPLEAGIAMVTDQAPVSFELLGSAPQVEQFREYAASYNKQYNSISELQTRFKAFQESLELIESTNNAALTYTLGLNQFADWTWEEFQSKMLLKSQNCSATKGTHVMSNRVLPEQVDWRKKGIVSAVKSQATCGSCWAFSTVGSLEAAHAQKTGEMVLLSEQQLVDCAGDYNNFGCMGGLPSQAFEYIHYNGGLDKAEAYPYKGVDGECHFDASRVGATVKNIVNITEYNEEELVDAVAFVRPVSIAYEVASDFRLYKNGVYSSPLCRQGPLTVNHAVVAVGFDRVGLGIPYFIVKNSWGTSWGEEGYFNIEMGKNMCGIATCASYPEV